MAITNEGRAETLRLIRDAVKEFRISNTTSPAIERDTDGGGAADGLTPLNYTSILTFPLTTADSVIDQVNGTITFNCSIGANDANGEIWTEIGLYFESGDLITREVISNPVLKENTNEMIFKIVINN